MERERDPLVDDHTIAKIAETLGRLDERTERIERDLLGNGQPGIKQRVEDLEAHQNRVLGAFGILGGLGATLWGILEYLFHFKGGK